MYKTKKEVIWTVTQSLGEKRKINVKELELTGRKRTTRVIACYCWKEDGRLFQSLLLFGLFPCCCFFFFLVCAVSMDSSKVGKCRIACRSCLSRGRETKNKTHTHKLQFPLFEKALSTHIRQECCCFSFPPFSFFGCFPPCLVGNNRCRHTLFCFKSLVVVDLICFPRWFVSQ